MSLPIKDLGPCSVTWDPDGTPLELGPTTGGVKFSDEPKYKQINTDQHGETPVDAIFTGRDVQVVVPMTLSSLAQLEKVIAASVKGTSNLKVSSPVGTSMFSSAKALLIKPMTNGAASSTESEWLRVHRAYPVGKTNFDYDAGTQRKVEVTFICFPDDTSGQVDEMWRIGAAS